MKEDDYSSFKQVLGPRYVADDSFFLSILPDNM